MVFCICIEIFPLKFRNGRPITNGEREGSHYEREFWVGVRCFVLLMNA